MWMRNADGSLMMDANGNPIPMQAVPGQPQPGAGQATPPGGATPPAAAPAPVGPQGNQEVARSAAIVGESPAVRWQREAQAAQARATESQRLANEAAARANQVDQNANQQIQQLQNQFQEYSRTTTEAVRQAQHEAYLAKLETYRQQVIATYRSQIIPGMVAGGTPVEIDAAAKASHDEWKRIRMEAEQEATARFTGPGTPAGTIPNVPPLPANAVPQHIQPLAGTPPIQGAIPIAANPALPIPQAGMWPTATNPNAPLPASAQPDAPVFGGMTTEQAVRSGVYGQMRNGLHTAVQGGVKILPFPSAQLPQQATQYPGFPGANIPQMNLPQGVVQPQPGPMGPVMRHAGQTPQQFVGLNAQQPAQPTGIPEGYGVFMTANGPMLLPLQQAQQPVQPQQTQYPVPPTVPQPFAPQSGPVQLGQNGVDPAALQAIQNLRNGTSPAMNDPEVAKIQAQQRQFVAGGQAPPQQVFNQRFAATPAGQ